MLAATGWVIARPLGLPTPVRTVSDALTVRGVDVRHITGTGEPSVHRITPFAVVEGGRVTYPPPYTLALGEE